MDEDTWLEFTSHALGFPICGLCGNTGVIDTTLSAWSSAGMRCGIRRFCICPNGRAYHEERGGKELSELAIQRSELSFLQRNFGIEGCTFVFDKDDRQPQTESKKPKAKKKKKRGK